MKIEIILTDNNGNVRYATFDNPYDADINPSPSNCVLKIREILDRVTKNLEDDIRTFNGKPH